MITGRCEIRAMKRFLVEWHEASGIPDVMPDITPRAERVAVVVLDGPDCRSRAAATKGYQVTVFDSLPMAAARRTVSVSRHSACRARPSRWTCGSSSGSACASCSTTGEDITFDQLQRDFDSIAITAGAMDAVALDIPGVDLEQYVSEPRTAPTTTSPRIAALQAPALKAWGGARPPTRRPRNRRTTGARSSTARHARSPTPRSGRRRRSRTALTAR